MTTSTTLTWPVRATAGFAIDDTEARREATRHRAPVAADLTVIVPAFNEASRLADTVHSLRGQSLVPTEIIVVDDCSTDTTPAVARALAVTVVRPPEHTGSKAGAQNFALQFVETKYVMTVDADTVPARDSVTRLRMAFGDRSVVAAFGSLLPRRVRSLWERGRYVESLLASAFHEQTRDFYGAPAVASGTFAMYATDAVRQAGGWPERTLAEDIDLTWSFLRQGATVRFVPEAVAYTTVPAGIRAVGGQLRRRSHGLVQNLTVHGQHLLRVRGLRLWVVTALLDWALAISAFFVALPLLALFVGQPWPLLGYFVDLPLVAVPVLVGAYRRREVVRALVSLPAFWLLRFLSVVTLAEAIWSEGVRGRRPAPTPVSSATPSAEPA